LRVSVCALARGVARAGAAGTSARANACPPNVQHTWSQRVPLTLTSGASNAGCQQRQQGKGHAHEHSPAAPARAATSLHVPSLHVQLNTREWGKKCFEDLDQRRMGRPATSTLEHGLSSPSRAKHTRDREMAQKQVQTMATEENVAPGSDWHILVRTTAGEVWL
jgi:hypothetical protein